MAAGGVWPPARQWLLAMRQEPRRLQLPVVALLVVMLSGCATVERWLAPAAEPWPRWSAHDETSKLAVDHRPWDRFLAANLATDDRGVARLAYGRVTDEDRRALDEYLAVLAATHVTRLGRNEQRAYWINLYNALMVRTVLEHYPVRSPLDIAISPGVLAFGPWGRKQISVEGEALSLDDIEHRILRPLWRDPRLHYALNCAAVGCPNLQAWAFTAANTEAMLESAARAHVNDRRGADLRDGRLTVSRIYVWFEEDFDGSEAGVLAHLMAYAEPPLATQLAHRRRIDASAYDWSLNDRP